MPTYGSSRRKVGYGAKYAIDSQITKAIRELAPKFVPIPVSPSSCAQRNSPASSPPLGGDDLFDLLGRVVAGIVRVRHKIGRAAEHDAGRHLHRWRSLFLGPVKIIGGKFGKPQKRSAFGRPVGNYFCGDPKQQSRAAQFHTTRSLF
jgi:hypothetical protein